MPFAEREAIIRRMRWRCSRFDTPVMETPEGLEALSRHNKGRRICGLPATHVPGVVFDFSRGEVCGTMIAS